jgi:DNA-binding PadR family transcriptional regulator
VKYLKKKRQLELFPTATDAEKEILRAILATHKKEMQEHQLRKRTEVDVYIEATSVHTLCARMVKKQLIAIARKESGGGMSGAPRNVFTVTQAGLEALQ